jgi:hypothetical protein
MQDEPLIGLFTFMFLSTAAYLVHHELPEDNHPDRLKSSWPLHTSLETKNFPKIFIGSAAACSTLTSRLDIMFSSSSFSDFASEASCGEEG